MDETILSIITTVNEYLHESAVNNTIASFDSYLSKNKSIFSVNITSDFNITKDDIKTIYSMITANINNDLIIDHIKNNKIKIDKNISKTIITKTLADKSEFLLFDIITEYGIITVTPKKSVLLWNVEKEKEIELSRLFSVNSESRFNIRYISFDKMYATFNTNREFYITNNTLIHFSNLTRILGTTLSNKSLKLHYTINLDISNTIYKLCVYDNISFTTMTISLDNKVECYNEFKVENIIKDYIDIIIRKLKQNNCIVNYYRLFITYPKLSYYIMYIFDDCTISNQLKKTHDNLLSVSYREPEKTEQYICEHVQALNKAIKPDQNFFININTFARDYIDAVNNVSSCKICKEIIQIFDQDERSYIQKDGEIVIMFTKENIFEYDPYKIFIDANVYFFDILSIFDNIFKTNLVNNINSIAKLSIDYIMYLAEKRLELENDKKMKDIIRDNDLFFVRLTNKIFTFSDDKEEYLKKKKLNMTLIITLVTCLFIGFDMVKQILITKNIDIIEKIKMSDKNSYNIFLCKAIKTFLTRSRIISDTKTKQNIDILVITYIDLLNDELNTIYRYNNLTFLDNIKRIEGCSTIYLFKCKRSIIDDKEREYSLEYHIPRDTIYRYQMTRKYIKESVEYPFDKRLIDFISCKIISYDELMESKQIIEDVDSLMKKSTFQKLYWKMEEIKIRPKELKNNMFIVNLENNNMFVDIDSSLNNSSVKIVCDHIYAFFNIGDPYPFIKNITKPHLIKILDSLQRTIIYFFPDSNPPLDIYPFLKGIYFNKTNTINRIFSYYLYYSIFSFLTNNKIEHFINTNKDKILKLYIQEQEKSYDIS